MCRLRNQHAGCGPERACIASEQPEAVALRCFNLLCAQTAQHELGVSGVSSDQFRSLKHKLILVFSSKSLWQKQHNNLLLLGAKYLTLSDCERCFCFSGDQIEQNTCKTQIMHPILLNIYGFFLSVTHLISPVCPGCGSERWRHGEADWSQSAGGKTNISSETNRGVRFIFSTHQLIKWPNLRCPNDSWLGRNTFGSNLSVDLLLLDGIREGSVIKSKRSGRIARNWLGWVFVKELMCPKDKTSGLKFEILPLSTIRSSHREHLVNFQYRSKLIFRCDCGRV